MLTYEYRCNACNKQFEVEQRISDKPHAVCPFCGSSDCQRLISLSSFILKGTGWYVTDYARKNGSQTGQGGSSRKDDKKGDKLAESVSK